MREVTDGLGAVTAFDFIGSSEDVCPMIAGRPSGGL